jgi:hypothetical protein
MCNCCCSAAAVSLPTSLQPNRKSTVLTNYSIHLDDAFQCKSHADIMMLLATCGDCCTATCQIIGMSYCCVAQWSCDSGGCTVEVKSRIRNSVGCTTSYPTAWPGPVLVHCPLSIHSRNCFLKVCLQTKQQRHAAAEEKPGIRLHSCTERKRTCRSSMATRTAWPDTCVFAKVGDSRSRQAQHLYIYEKQVDNTDTAVQAMACWSKSSAVAMGAPDR